MQRETVYDPVFDAQEHYRLLLDAMARPGTIQVLPRMALNTPSGLTGAAALVGFGLLNSDVSFYADGSDAAAITRYLVVNTGAISTTIEHADFVFAAGNASETLLADIKTGTLPYPEEGATLILAVEALATEAQGLGGSESATLNQTDRVAISLKGPGIDKEKTFFIKGLNPLIIDALKQVNQEFPLGIDLVLADPGSRLACIPRSSSIRLEIL